MSKHILLTGMPRAGKTTLLKRIIGELGIACQGFYTEEIIEGNKRIGFKIKTLNGKEGILAKKDLRSRFRLGEYGINIEDLEKIGLEAVEEGLRNKEIIVIDEIGKMELFSEKFKAMVLKVLDSGKRLVGVIHRQKSEFLDKIKNRADVLVFEVGRDNPGEIFREITSVLNK